MKRYLVLLAIAVTLGAVGLVAARGAPEAEAAARPEVTLEITITPEHGIAPAVAAVPKDHIVRITVTNRSGRPASLTLMGYEDRFGVASLPADSVVRADLVADRPGDDFAWQLDGAPVGRLAVTGSHLVEGHR